MKVLHPLLSRGLASESSSASSSASAGQCQLQGDRRTSADELCATSPRNNRMHRRGSKFHLRVSGVGDLPFSLVRTTASVHDVQFTFNPRKGVCYDHLWPSFISFIYSNNSSPVDQTPLGPPARLRSKLIDGASYLAKVLAMTSSQSQGARCPCPDHIFLYLAHLYLSPNSSIS